MNNISPITAIIDDIRVGKPVIMVDDEKRENEGDLIIAAECVTEEIINFMIRKCCGFVCLPMAPEMIDRLGLDLQPRRNVNDVQCPFTTSIEAKEGVTTGVSAADRVQTIKAAISPSSGPDDVSTPGHIFPLRAKAGGVLEREGHTEASVDLARLAGFQPAGVLCEIMNEDGTMARLPELVDFASLYGFKIGQIKDLAAHRKNAPQ